MHIYNLILEKKYDAVKSILKFIEQGNIKSVNNISNEQHSKIQSSLPLKASSVTKPIPSSNTESVHVEDPLQSKTKKVKLKDYNQIVQNIFDSKQTSPIEPIKENKQNDELLKKQEEDSLKLAKELMEKEKEEYEQSIKIKQNLKVECGICADTIQEKDIFPLYLCTHLFHKECIAQHIETQLQNKKFPIMCPNEECKQEIDEQDIEDFLSKDSLNKYKTFRLSSFIEANSDEYSCCPTADCKYIFFYEKDTDSNFECPICKKQYCLSCRCPYHQGQTCAEYKITNEHTV